MLTNECVERIVSQLAASKMDSHPVWGITAELAAFREFGTATRVEQREYQLSAGIKTIVPVFINEFWTAKQRQANAIHEISYRACFKPQLPRLFIERLTQGDEIVYDCFAGRGTTCIEAALLGRIPLTNDINPLSTMLIAPRLNPPTIEQVTERLAGIGLNELVELPQDLLVFYHPDTLRQLGNLRGYLLERKKAGGLDEIDRWIWMVALNRLTGHSPGFFSVYTLPPNQAVSVKRQRLINQEYNQSPEAKDVPALILKKSKDLLKDCNGEVLQVLREAGAKAQLFTAQADATFGIRENSISLVVTSPPFLDVVDYEGDNWLRCWFGGIDPRSVKLTICRSIDDWQAAMTGVFRELHRIIKPGGHVAFEVGEVHAGKTKLEEIVIPCGVAVGFEPLLVLINDQKFTKTANCWGVNNNSKGTNTNRVVLFVKPVD